MGEDGGLDVQKRGRGAWVKSNEDVVAMLVSIRDACTFAWLQRYLAHQKLPPPQDHHRVLGIGLL